VKSLKTEHDSQVVN